MFLRAGPVPAFFVLNCKLLDGFTVLKHMNKQQRFEALVRGHSSSLYRLAYWLCNGDKATAEDVVQETFLRAWKSLDQLQDSSSAKAWLTTILRRENARRFERKQLDYVDIEPADVPIEDHSFAMQLDRMALREAMLKLEPQYREPLLLQIVGGFSCEEIAQMMQIKRGAVMTRLFRAKKMLNEMMSPTTQEHAHG